MLDLRVYSAFGLMLFGCLLESNPAFMQPVDPGPLPGTAGGATSSSATDSMNTSAPGASTTGDTSSGSTSDGSSSPDLADDLVAAFSFEEPSGDLHADAIDPNRTLQMFESISATGRFGRGLTLPHAGAYGQIFPDDTFDELDVGTLSFWFRVSEDEQLGFGWKGIFAAVPTDCSQDFSFGLDDGQLRLDIGACGNPMVSTPVGDGIDFDWHHVAYAVGPTSNTLYLDGTAVYFATSHLFFADVAEGLTHYTLGKPPLDATASFLGQIDELRIYGRSLSDEEIVIDMNATLEEL